MPTVELFKDGNRVIVDIGSEPEVVWRGMGFCEKNEQSPVVNKEQEMVESDEANIVPKRQGRPAKK